MSSQPFKLGLSIVDDMIYFYPVPLIEKDYIFIAEPEKWPEKHFILRANNRDDINWKIEKIRRTTPKELEISVKYIGLRPDKRIPIPKYFAEIYIHQPNQTITFLSFFDATYPGKYDLKRS